MDPQRTLSQNSSSSLWQERPWRRALARGTEMAGAGDGQLVVEEVLLKIGAMLVVACASLLGALPPLWQQPRSHQAAGTALSDTAYLTRAFTVSPCHVPDPCAPA